MGIRKKKASIGLSSSLKPDSFTISALSCAVHISLGTSIVGRNKQVKFLCVVSVYI